MVDTNGTTQRYFTEICVRHKLKNTSEFVCSITLCLRLFHIGTTEKKNEFLTTSTRENFKVSFFEWETTVHVSFKRLLHMAMISQQKLLPLNLKDLD